MRGLLPPTARYVDLRSLEVLEQPDATNSPHTVPLSHVTDALQDNDDAGETVVFLGVLRGVSTYLFCGLTLRQSSFLFLADCAASRAESWEGTVENNENPSDKNMGLTVIDQDWYIDAAKKHLSNSILTKLLRMTRAHFC